MGATATIIDNSAIISYFQHCENERKQAMIKFENAIKPKIMAIVKEMESKITKLDKELKNKVYQVFDFQLFDFGKTIPIDQPISESEIKYNLFLIFRAVIEANLFKRDLCIPYGTRDFYEIADHRRSFLYSDRPREISLSLYKNLLSADIDTLNKKWGHYLLLSNNTNHLPRIKTCFDTLTDPKDLVS